MYLPGRVNFTSDREYFREETRIRDDEAKRFRSISADKIKLMAEHSIVDYIRDVALITGKDLDSRIRNYLIKVPKYLPLDNVFIGQNPYESDILPHTASALSINPYSMDEYPPSISVLSQFISGNKDTALTLEAASALSNSFILLECSIMFINVFPTEVKCYPTKIRLMSAFAELMRSICLLNRRLSVKSTILHCLGEEPKYVAKMITSSLKSNDVSPMTIRKISYKNPVWISRSFNGYIGDPMLVSSPYTKEAYDESIGVTDLTLLLTSKFELPYNKRNDQVITYSYGVMKTMGGSIAIRKLFRERVQGRLPLILRRYLAKEVNSVLEMKKTAEATNKHLYSELTSKEMYGRKQQTPSEIYMEKTIETYKNMASKCIELTKQMDESSKKISQILSSLESELTPMSENKILECVDDIKLYTDLCHKTTAFFGKIPALALSQESLCFVTGSSSTALMKVTESSQSSTSNTIEFIKPSLSSLDDLTNERIGVEPTDASAADDIDQRENSGTKEKNARRDRLLSKIRKNKSSAGHSSQGAYSNLPIETVNEEAEQYYEEMIDTIDYESGVQNQMSYALSDPTDFLNSNDGNEGIVTPDSVNKTEISYLKSDESRASLVEVPNKMQQFVRDMKAKNKSRTSSSSSSVTSIVPDDSASHVSVSSNTSNKSRKELIMEKLNSIKNR